MQIVSFGVAALYSGMWWLRWARVGGREGEWGQLGWFSGMVCVGSIAGAVAWGANMYALALYYEINAPALSPQQAYSMFASSCRFFAVFFFLYGVAFLCLIICKLMLLGRLAANAAQSSQAEVTEMSGVRRKWLGGRALPIVYRVMAGAVVVGSVVGMVADAVAGALMVQEAGVVDQIAAACDAAGNKINSSCVFNNEVNVIAAKARTSQSVQASSEALTLLLVSIAFLAIVSWSVALFRMLERVAARVLVAANGGRNTQPSEESAARIAADTMQAAAEQRRRLTAACVIVLITFPARAAFDLLQAYAFFNDPHNNACGPCDACQSTPSLVHHWLNFTPEFQAIVVAVSSPLPLTLSLWLLTKVRARVRLIAADLEKARACDGV